MFKSMDGVSQIDSDYGWCCTGRTQFSRKVAVLSNLSMQSDILSNMEYSLQHLGTSTHYACNFNPNCMTITLTCLLNPNSSAMALIVYDFNITEHKSITLNV